MIEDHHSALRQAVRLEEAASMAGESYSNLLRGTVIERASNVDGKESEDGLLGWESQTT